MYNNQQEENKLPTEDRGYEEEYFANEVWIEFKNLN
jgi:hypothetical protein